MDDLPKSKRDAIAAGARYYWTGKQCLNGHYSKRNLSNNCVTCTLAWRTAHRDPAKRKQYYADNKDQENLTARLYYKANRQKRRQDAREYRKAKVEWLRRKNFEWRRQNPTYAAEHREKNKARYAIYSENRRCRLLTGKLSRDIVDKLLKLQNSRCAVCQRPLGPKFHIDHITPLSAGGLNDDANVQLTHAVCNYRKGRQLPEAFMRTLGWLL